MSVPAWPYPARCAHRGAGKLAPENTLAAIRHGAALGYRMFEFDVKLSADGVLVLMHDPTVDRTTSGHGHEVDGLQETGLIGDGRRRRPASAVSA